MTNIRCPACGMVWDLNAPPAKRTAASPAANAGKDPTARSSPNPLLIPLIAGLLAFMVAAVAAFLIVRMAMNPPEQAPVETAQAEPEDVWFQIQEYREVSKPEPERKRIYGDLRTAAVKTIEKPLPLPDGSPPRTLMEKTLQATFDDELRKQAALNNLSVDDLKEIIKEGDAKTWDPSPRSNATRGGKRIYPKKMSEGWKR